MTGWTTWLNRTSVFKAMIQFRCFNVAGKAYVSWPVHVDIMKNR